MRAALDHIAMTIPIKFSLLFPVRLWRDEKVTDGHGKTVVQTVSDGPFLLAKLPAGHYRVEATQDGQPKVREVSVKAGTHQRVVFEWAA